MTLTANQKKVGSQNFYFDLNFAVYINKYLLLIFEIVHVRAICQTRTAIILKSILCLFNWVLIGSGQGKNNFRRFDEIIADHEVRDVNFVKNSFFLVHFVVSIR